MNFTNSHSIMSGLTVHLALVRKYDFASPARRVDSERLLEALLDVGAPHSLRIRRRHILGSRLRHQTYRTRYSFNIHR